MKEFFVTALLLGAVLLAAAPAEESKLSQKFLDMRQGALTNVAGQVGVLFLGDSITAGWRRSGATGKLFKDSFGKWNPVNFGIGGYTSGHVLQYVENGGIAGIHPKAVVLLIGVNDTNGLKDTGDQIAGRVKRIVESIRKQEPATKIIVTAIFPRGPQAERQETWENKGNQRMAIITSANKEIARLDDGKSVRVLDLTEKFLVDGKPTKELQSDLLHLSAKGYEIWAAGLVPLLTDAMK